MHTSAPAAAAAAAAAVTLLVALLLPLPPKRQLDGRRLRDLRGACEPRAKCSRFEVNVCT